MKMDLHIHSVFSSDGRESPEDIVKYARKIGLDGIAILDHNDVRGSLKAYKMSRDMEGFFVVKGLEISTKAGHLVAYGVAEPIPPGMTIRETIENIRDLGGLAVAPHPYRFWSGVGGKSVNPEHFSAVEVQNARCTARNNRKSRRLAQKLRLGQTGGTDSHELKEMGKAYTLFEYRPASEDDVLEEIAKRRTTAGGESRQMRGTLEYVYSSVTKWMRRGMRKI
ncbi:MAG: CehA/McbA family metallohydrolase [Thermoplasmata archaeon]